LGEEIKESVIVQKVLRSLPMRFDPKISALEERAYLDSISMDELHGIFIAYEMRTEQENPDIKEASFKASKRSKQKEKEHSNNSDISEDDEDSDSETERVLFMAVEDSDKEDIEEEYEEAEVDYRE
jgi:hypothetical protein